MFNSFLLSTVTHFVYKANFLHIFDHLHSFSEPFSFLHSSPDPSVSKTLLLHYLLFCPNLTWFFLYIFGCIVTSKHEVAVYKADWTITLYKCYWFWHILWQIINSSHLVSLLHHFLEISLMFLRMNHNRIINLVSCCSPLTHHEFRIASCD